MSFTDHFNPHPIRRPSAETTATPSAGDELKALLQQIAGQIAEVDRRHTDAMADMQGRLEKLAAEAERARADGPTAASPSLLRIEDGVAALSDRIGAVNRDRAQARAETIAAVNFAADSVNPAPELPAPVDPIAAFVPAPLRSALSALDTALQASDPRNAAKSVLDPFDFAPASGPHDVTDPWDRDQAEALSKLYETGEAAPKLPIAEIQFPEPVAPALAPEPLPAPAPEAVSPPMPVAARVDQIAALLAQETVPPTRVEAGLGHDKSWLEDKFADIARSVERSLAEVRPDSALLAMSTRLDGLETRFGEALDGVARRSDLEGLSQIENQIADIAAQFEKAQGQLSRLDVVEWQMKELTERIAEMGERQSALAQGHSAFSQDHAAFVRQHAAFVSSQSARPLANPAPAFDADALAQATAERVAARMNSLNPPRPPEPAPSRELDTMMRSYIDERRRGDEQTAMALDTMQEALVRLIDRVEMVDAPQASDTQAAASFQPMVGQSQAAAAPPVEDEAALAPAPTFGRKMPAAAPARVATAAPAHDMIEDQADADARAAAARAIPARALPHSLKDFEAAALRAKAKASAQGSRQPAAEASDEESEAPIQPKAAARGRLGQKLPVSPVVLVATLCTLLVGAGFAFYTLNKPGQPGKIDGRMPVQALPAPNAAPGQPQTGPQGQPVFTRVERPQPAAAPAGAAPSPNAPAPAAARPAAGEPAKAATEKTPPAPLRPAADTKSDANEPLLAPVPRQRSEPETVTDDLSQNDVPPASAPAAPAQRNGSSDAAPAEQRTAAAALPRAPVGIAMQQSGNGPNIEELMRIQQRQRMAAASSRLGAIQANRPFMPIGANAVPAAATPAPTAAETAAVETAEPVTKPSSALDLPPAMIGPMSLRMAAAKGDPSAEFEVAARFAEGKGVPQDFVQANVWYQRSAARGFAQAQYRLGTLYERGVAVPLDAARAKIWYKRAAEQGNVKAMHNLAVLAAGADQATPDYETAGKWFAQAADYGLADSQFNLGVLYENGLGVGKDQREAYKWYSLAARAGDREASKRRDAIRVKIDAVEAKRAELTVLNFRAKLPDTRINDARVAGDAWRTRPEQPAPNTQITQPVAEKNAPSAKVLPVIAKQ